jgi:hypothetical protein
MLVLTGLSLGIGIGIKILEELSRDKALEAQTHMASWIGTVEQAGYFGD